MPPKLLINSPIIQTPFLSVNGGTSVPTNPSFFQRVGDFLSGNPITKGVTDAFLAPPAQKSFDPIEIANAGWDSLTAGIKQSANAISNFENTLGDVFGTAVARATATPQAKPYITSSVSPLDVGVSTANASLGIANAAFAPLTSAIQAVAHIPGVGYAADALNNIMGAVGQAGAIPTGLAVDSAYQKGIISADTRDKIKPPLQNFAALLAQVAVGKVGADAIGDIKAKATEAVNSMNMAIETAKKAYEMGPVKPLIVNGESTTNPVSFANDYRAPEGIIQMGAKPRETLPVAAYSPSEAPVATESARTATIPSKTENIPPELQPLAQEARKYKSAEEFVRAQLKNDFTEQYIAAQDLAKEMRSNGLRPVLNADGTITIYHGTTAENAKIIVQSGKINEGSYFSPNKYGTDYYSKIKGKGGESIAIKVDPRSIQYGVSTGEIYADKGLIRGVNNVWYSPERQTASQLTDFYNKVTNPTVPEANQSLTTPESRLVPLNEPATKEVIPQKTGEITKVASDINQTLVKQGFDALSPEEQSKYTAQSYKEQAQHIASEMDTNIENVKAMAVGEKPVPAKINGQILFNTVEAYATKMGDGELLTKLASSPLGKKLSEAGQTLGGHGFNDNPNSPVEAIRRVQESRQASLKAKGVDIAKETAKETATIKSEITKAIKTSRPKWEDFINQITCGY